MNDYMHHDKGFGVFEWVEFGIFAFLVLTVIIMLIRLFCDKFKRECSEPEVKGSNIHYQGGWRTMPEFQLIILALPLEILWEIAQFPLYTVWHEGSWSYILYGLVHCTIGDILILLSIFWLVALLNWNRRWYLDKVLPNGLLFTVLGVGYTIGSEIVNVRIKGTWGYTELMPIVPVFEVGGMPFLQWVFIPPLLLLLMRAYSKALNAVETA